MINRIITALGLVAVVMFRAVDLFAQAATSAPAAELTFPQRLMSMMPMVLIIVVIFHFLVLRPQEKKMKLHQKLMGTLAKGDTVVTTGGIIGRVAGIEEDHIVLEVAPSVKLKLESAHIVRRFVKKEEAKAA